MKPAGAARLAPTLMTWAALGVAGMYPIDNPDTFGHLALGRQIVELGRVPQYDSFSYFQPSPARFVNYEWLSDWLFFVLYRAAGPSGLHALKLVLAGLLAWLLVRTAQLCAARGAVWLVPLAMLVGLPGIRFRWSVRPHLFGTVLAALYLLGLRRMLSTESLRERRTWLVGLAGAHVVWVNLHGSHLLGLVLTALACVCCWRDRMRLRWLSGLLGLMLLGSCVSPYGPAIVSDAIAHTFDPRYRVLIEEWRPYQLSQPLWYPATFALQTLLIVGARLLGRGRAAPLVSLDQEDTAKARARVSLFETLYVLLLLLMAARSLRFLADAVALTIPVVAAGWAQALRAWSPGQRARGLAASCVLGLGFAIAACLSLPPQGQFGFGVSDRGRPEASARWLAANWPDARVLAAMADAWDLMFSLPRARFLLDGRAPFYGPEHIARVQRAWSSPSQLRALLDSTQTDVVVAQPALQEQQRALRSLLAAPDFRLVAIEAEHCVFARASRFDQQSLGLEPGYDPQWLTAATLEPARVLRELRRLGDHPNVQPYAAWVRALIALRPLLREGGTAGIRWPRTPEERARLTAALQDLRLSHEALPLVQTVGAYHGLVAGALCELDEARAAFSRSNALGPVRETLLGAQELALREGRDQDVRAFLEQASSLPEAKDDAWLAALRGELAHPVRCAAP